jgi:hypothetical protein
MAEANRIIQKLKKKLLYPYSDHLDHWRSLYLITVHTVSKKPDRAVLLGID